MLYDDLNTFRKQINALKKDPLVVLRSKGDIKYNKLKNNHLKVVFKCFLIVFDFCLALSVLNHLYYQDWWLEY